MKLNKNEERSIVLEHINFFVNNKNPLDKKGNEYISLHYIIEDYETINKFFDALLVNESFKGELMIDSSKYDDNIGYKIANLISKNKLTKFKIGNRNKPFSDRIAKMIGDALEHNTSLRSLEIFLNIESISPLHICKFLKNPKSNLENLSYLKLNKNLFDFYSTYLSKSSKLKSLKFYFEPLKFIDLMYEPLIDKETYHKLADKIQCDSNVLNVDVIPLFEDFEAEINHKVTADIYELKETLKFSCDINLSELGKKIDIEKTYEEENNKMSEIIEKLDLITEKNKTNSIISIRSYLNRTIGECLNNALYELEIARERNQDNEDLFTAKGSIKFVAKFLMES
jgi:hypothetical protein